MKQKALLKITLITLLSLILTSCKVAGSIFNPIPENYTEGISYDRYFPDDILELYEDAIVFEEDNDDDEMSITAGSEDDLDDIVDFYADFFEDNDIIVLEEKSRHSSYYAEFELGGYLMEIEIEKADGVYTEELFRYIITYTVRELSQDELDNLYTEDSSDTASTPEPTSDIEPTATTEPGDFL